MALGSACTVCGARAGFTPSPRSSAALGTLWEPGLRRHTGAQGSILPGCPCSRCAWPKLLLWLLKSIQHKELINHKPLRVPGCSVPRQWHRASLARGAEEPPEPLQRGEGALGQCAWHGHFPTFPASASSLGCCKSSKAARTPGAPQDVPVTPRAAPRRGLADGSAAHWALLSALVPGPAVGALCARQPERGTGHNGCFGQPCFSQPAPREPPA